MAQMEGFVCPDCEVELESAESLMVFNPLHRTIGPKESGVSRPEFTPLSV